MITGAGSGIGRQMARRFLAEGANVLGADCETAGLPPGVYPLNVDVSAPDDVRAMIETAVRQWGRVDVLCNNAGIGSTSDVISCEVDEWDRIMAVNVRGVFLGTKYVLPYMLREKRGVIINMASVAGLVGLPDRAAYSASKGAVIALTRQVAVQVAGTGVRCNCICPGTIDSPWVERLLAESGDPDQRRAELVARQPMGRLGDPDEVAEAALYLASDAASFVTGAQLVIDGGLVAG